MFKPKRKNCERRLTVDTCSLKTLIRLAHGIAVQFGQNCEVVIHDLTHENLESSIVYIENGHVSSRSAGDGPSHVVLDSLNKPPETLEDHLGYLTRTADGRILKSSTMYIRSKDHRIAYILAVNFDITGLLAIEASLKALTETETTTDKSPEKITQNVNDLLDDLLEQSVTRIGKPVALMTKDDKVSAIQFLNDAGAFLITKSGDKISKYFGISKYTLYSYIDVNK